MNDKAFPDNIDTFFFAKAWRVFVDNRLFFLKLILAAAAVSTIMYLLFAVPIGDRLQSAGPETGTLDPAVFGSGLFLMFLSGFVNLVPNTFLMIILIQALPAMYEERDVGFQEALRVPLPLWYRLFVYSVFVTLVEIAGTLMCLVPGIIAVIQFSLLPFVIILEPESPVFSRAFRLVSGRQWSVFLLYIAYSIPIILMIIGSMLFSPGAEAGETQGASMTLSSVITTFFESIFNRGFSYILVILFFQLYMMSRIDLGEIEVIRDDTV